MKARLSKAENRYCEALVRVVCKENDDISKGTIKFLLINVEETKAIRFQ